MLWIVCCYELLLTNILHHVTKLCQGNCCHGDIMLINLYSAFNESLKDTKLGCLSEMEVRLFVFTVAVWLYLVASADAFQSSYWSTNRHEVYGSVLNKEGKVVHHLFGKWNEGIYFGAVQSAKCVWRPGVYTSVCVFISVCMSECVFYVCMHVCVCVSVCICVCESL